MTDKKESDSLDGEYLKYMNDVMYSDKTKIPPKYMTDIEEEMAMDFYEDKFPKLKRALTPSICMYLMHEYSAVKDKEIEELKEELTSANKSMSRNAYKGLKKSIENQELKERVKEFEIIPQPTEIEELLKKRSRCKVNDEFGWTGEYSVSSKHILDLILELLTKDKQ